MALGGRHQRAGPGYFRRAQLQGFCTGRLRGCMVVQPYLEYGFRVHGVSLQPSAHG